MLGYYLPVDHINRLTASENTCMVLPMLCILMTACQSPESSLAIIDPVFAYLSPDSVKTYASAAQEFTILPDSNASTTLYATLDTQAPKTVFLSPLLASEIEPILSRNDETRVVYLGTVHPKPHPRLLAAIFYESDAAAQGGELAAAESNRLMAKQANESPPPRVAAVFAGISEAESCSAAFTKAYREAGGSGEPIIEISSQGFANSVAERLKTLDIRVGYISAAPRDAERWVRLAFDQYAYIALEYALPSRQTSSQADAFVIWDMDTTLSALVKKLSVHDSSPENGHWKIVYNDETGINRR